MPEFRRYGGYTAFTEGWALYAERLGGDLGLYRDPYSRFGQLSYEMWRALRLVLDTGIHELGWSREQAIAYFQGEQRQVGSGDRDRGGPLRRDAGPGAGVQERRAGDRLAAAEAERELGSRFDIRAFHDAVLSQGALPLDILDARVRRWMSERKKSD